MVESDLKVLGRKQPRNKNILKIIRNIEKKKDVVIRPAEKGRGLVILSKKDNEEKMENLLRVENAYKNLKNNPKKEYEKKLYKLRQR